jgi:membrane protease YdiL (CAAX protease family)
MYDEKKQLFKLTSFLPFFLYILLLFITAITRDFHLTPLITSTLGPIAAAFVEPLWKLIFWILPALLYIAWIDRFPILSYLKLVSNVKRGIAWGLLGSSLFFVRLLVRGLLAGFHHQLSFDDWLNSVILVGLIEELIFRGFIFQQLRAWWWKEASGDASSSWLVSFMKMYLEWWMVLLDGWKGKKEDEENEEEVDVSRWIPNRGTFWAATVSALLFVAIHFPVWIETRLPLDQMITTSLYNLIFGYVLCFVFTQSRSLWSCILMHSLNDLVMTLIGP